MSTQLPIIPEETTNSPADYPIDHDSINRWIFETIEPYILKPTLEMESGLGSIAAFFAQKGHPIHLSDKSKEYRDKLRVRFHEVETVKNVHNIDFSHPDFESRYADVFSTFGTVIALNVLEKGYFDESALRNARYLLQTRGRLIFLAPAYTSMFFGWEENPERWRRYNFDALNKFLKSNFELITTQYLNVRTSSGEHASVSLGLSVLAVARQL